MLLLLQTCLAQIPQNAIGVTLRAESGTYKTLGEAMLEVSFTNQTNGEITFEFCNYHGRTLVQSVLPSLLALLPLCFAQTSQNSIGVTLTSEWQKYKTLGEAVLEVHITNPTSNIITTETVGDPPISLEVKGENGDLAVKTALLNENRHSKRPEFRLEPHQTKVYKRTITGFLGLGQSLEKTDSTLFQITALVHITTYQDGKIQLHSFRSNVIQVRVDPYGNLQGRQASSSQDLVSQVRKAISADCVSASHQHIR